MLKSHTTTRIISVQIRGYVVGALWWPTGAEAWKDLNYDLTRESGRFMTRPGLRDHLVNIISDGDFQGGATIAQGSVIVRIFNPRRNRTVTREFPLSRF